MDRGLKPATPTPNMMPKIDKHRPPHIYSGESVFFITASTWNKDGFITGDEKKELLKNCIFEFANKYGANIFAWVILDNHYHVEFEINDSNKVPEFIRYAHGKSAKLINDTDGKRDRKIWYQYWDSAIRGEIDFWKRFNYIHQNPVKHKYCSKMSDYNFSSYSEYDSKWLDDCFVKYPIIDFVVDRDN